MPRKRKLARWEGRLGVWPHVVWYGERADKGGVCYTRTWSAARGNWIWQSCRTKVRDTHGNLDAAAQAAVLELAKQRHDRLTGKLSPLAAELRAPVTIGQAWAILTGEDGRFPNRTPYRDELKAGIDEAARVLGSDFAWMHLDEAAFTRVIRHKVKTARAKKFTGFRVAIQIGTSLITIMGLLRDSGRIPGNVAVPGGRRWREDLKKYVTDLSDGIEPDVQRPRHSIDELRAIIAAAPKVDPRFALMLALGAEIRIGQVRRARRSSLDLERGIFRSPGRGGKKGAIVELTAGQLRAVNAALTGYLVDLEGTLPDFPLFPAGRLVHKGEQVVATIERHGEAAPVDKRTLNDWFRAAETVAQVEHKTGRGAYGLKRRAVDEALALGISKDALQEHGGWTSDRMPNTVYRDQRKDAARHEASEVRAKIRGEKGGDSVQLNVPGPEKHERSAES